MLCFIPFCLIRWFKKPLFLLNGACFIAALLFSCLQSTAALTITEILFSYEAGFVVRSHSIDELYALCSDPVDNVNENVPQKQILPHQMPGISLIFKISLICKNGKKKGRKP